MTTITTATSTTKLNGKAKPGKTKPTVKKPQNAAQSGAKASASVTAQRAAKAVSKPKSRPQSAIAAMREVLAGNPHATVEEIGAVLDKKGLSKSPVTIATIKSDFWGTYRALTKAGALKSPVVQ